MASNWVVSSPTLRNVTGIFGANAHQTNTAGAIHTGSDGTSNEAVDLVVRAFERAGAALAVGDAQGRLLRVNDALCSLLGRESAELLGSNLLEFTHPEDLELTHAARERFGRVRYEKRYIRPDGSIVWALVGGEVITDDQGDRFFVGSAVDITEQKRAQHEASRRAAQQTAVSELSARVLAGGDVDSLFATALEMVASAVGIDRASIWQLDASAGMIDLRAGWMWSSAVDQGMRLPVRDSFAGVAADSGASVVVPDVDRETRHPVHPLLRAEDIHSSACVVIRVDGAVWGTLSAHSAVTGQFTEDSEDVVFLQSIADVLGAAISSHQHGVVAARALQQERLAHVGQLAAGLAHDFNNVLTVIKLHAELLGIRQPLDAEGRRQIAAISQQSERAIGLVWQLLDIARRDDIRPTDVDLAVFLEDLTIVVRRTVPQGVHLDYHGPDRPLVVSADVGALNQIVLALVGNAVDALPEGGSITIRARACSQGRRRGASLEVIDDGVGMAGDVAARAFDPFFSTKGPGGGTGLGLAQVYALVTQHGGTVTIDSAEGAGATVRVWLPRSLGAPPVVPTGADVSRGLGQRILLVEDDPAVAESVAGIVTELGYDVLVATDGIDALSMVDADEEIALVLSDLRMPRLDGEALAAEVHRRRADLPVVLGSAYELRPAALREHGGPAVAWIQKPYSRADLASILAAHVGKP